MGKEPTKLSNKGQDTGKYVDLPNAKEGEVVVRFPPEASGYLHIGHAKAALLNQYYQQAFKGKLIFRFDDTNPEKEKEDFEEVIREDVKLLQIEPDICSYTSDHFDVYIDKVVQLIEEGKAYVDDTPAEQMKQEREARVESKCRKNSVDQNLRLWQEMVKGTELGLKCCVRAKIDMNSPNGCMRDPTLFRCKKQAHPRTGNKYNVYPTYDFACPIVDSIEGVTHALRTTEYDDRNDQYLWVLEQLGMRKPHIVSYSRLNMSNSVFSKRKLTWFVENKVVEGWDDPRMPTIRGALRRGLTVEGLKQFILSQGSSRTGNLSMGWDKIWSLNTKVIDAHAVRYSAVVADDAVPVTIVDADPNGTIEVARHPKNAEMGTRIMKIGRNVLVDRVDAEAMKPCDTVTFINWGNMEIKEVIKSSGNVSSIVAQLKLDDRNFKNTLKCTWINADTCIRTTFVYYDHLIAKSVLAKDDEFKNFINKKSKFELSVLVEPEVDSIKVGNIIQVLRKGFFICDSENPRTLISIPDGSTDLNIFSPVVQEWKKRCIKLQQSFDSKEANKQQTNKTNAADTNGDKISSLLQSIKLVGDEIREMKVNKADKFAIDAKVKELLSLKAEYETISGKKWTPDTQPPTQQQSLNVSTSLSNHVNVNDDVKRLDEQIKRQGDEIRSFKASKAPKDQLDPLIEKLKALKLKYKNVTGNEWQPPSSPTSQQPKKEKGTSSSTGGEAKQQPPSSTSSKKKESKTKGEKEKSKMEQSSLSSDQAGLSKKQTRLGLETKKADNFAEWYTEVITKSEMIEYYDVSGCYILRPWAYSIWESIVSFFDAKIKQVGVQNCYFPMFVTAAALQKEKDHIADFAPEVAWVTKSGDSDLPEPIAIRPTSETVMYPSFAKWVQSHRDLPIRINQWCNIVRWESKNPTPFLRTREFLWQEGHSAWADKQEAIAEVYQILDFYAQVYQELLAVPVIKGRKTEKEKFPGGEFTTTIEGFIAFNGRGIQAATSHHLGENFSKMFEIVFQDPKNPDRKEYAYQNSYGLTTRSIGTMIMTHSDDKGLVLPPRVAPIQVVIVPCGITAKTSKEEHEQLLDACIQLGRQLAAGGVKVKSDLSDHYSPGWKYNHWELKGVPIRIELGPKDLSTKSFVAVRRDDGSKTSFSLSDAVSSISALLNTIQSSLFSKAKRDMDNSIVLCTDWNQFNPLLDNKKMLLSPFCGGIECEENIKKDSTKEDSSGTGSTGPLMGAKSLCIPLEQPRPIDQLEDKCIHPKCNAKPQFFTLFGRSY